MSALSACVETPTAGQFQFATGAERKAALTDVGATAGDVAAVDGDGDAQTDAEDVADIALEVAADVAPDAEADTDAALDVETEVAAEIDSADTYADAGVDTPTEEVQPLCATLVCADDGNPCTDAYCNPSKGCAQMANEATCTDGNACTLGDQCKDAACLPGAATGCDDGNACTTDACVKATGCVNVANTATCTDDGNACSLDVCAAGVCTHPFAANNAPCDDKDPCTVPDGCTGGLCMGLAPKACNDSNPCSDDACDKGTGACVALANAVTCSDGDACTEGDKCDSKACAPGAKVVCDDKSPCTDDSCEPNAGCTHTPLTTVTCAVGCPPTGSGIVCGNGVGKCENGHCIHTDAKGYKWTLVPAGKFWMGCNPVVDSTCTSYAYENPQHEVELSGYWIGVYEVTAELYKGCVTSGASGCTFPQLVGGSSWSTYGASGKEKHPANYIFWSQAQAVCKWLGGDLPTEAQWEKAARGGCDVYAGQDCKASTVKYPWGDSEPICGQNAVHFLDPGTCGQAYKTFAVGAGSAKGASPYGAYDMAGNVWEWTLDWYEAGFFKSPGAIAKDAWNGVATSAHVLRGGGFDDPTFFLRSGHRTGSVNGNHTLGVRCAKPAN